MNRKILTAGAGLVAGVAAVSSMVMAAPAAHAQITNYETPNATAPMPQQPVNITGYHWAVDKGRLQFFATFAYKDGSPMANRNVALICTPGAVGAHALSSNEASNSAGQVFFDDPIGNEPQCTVMAIFGARSTEDAEVQFNPHGSVTTTHNVVNPAASLPTDSPVNSNIPGTTNAPSTDSTATAATALSATTQPNLANTGGRN